MKKLTFSIAMLFAIVASAQNPTAKMILAPSYDNCDNALLIPVRHSFQLVISQDSKTKETQVACTSLASGNYIVKIHTDYGVQMARIAK